MKDENDFIISALLARAQVCFENMEAQLSQADSSLRRALKSQAQGLAAVVEVRRLLGYSDEGYNG